MANLTDFLPSAGADATTLQGYTAAQLADSFENTARSGNAGLIKHGYFQKAPQGDKTTWAFDLAGDALAYVVVQESDYASPEQNVHDGGPPERASGYLVRPGQGHLERLWGTPKANEFKGEWVVGTRYTRGDIVTYKIEGEDEQAYVAIDETDPPHNRTPPGSSNFELLTSENRTGYRFGAMADIAVGGLDELGGSNGYKLTFPTELDDRDIWFNVWEFRLFGFDESTR